MFLEICKVSISYKFVIFRIKNMAIIQIKQSTKLHFATSQLLAGSRKDYDWCLNVCFLIPTSASILALVLAFVFGG